MTTVGRDRSSTSNSTRSPPHCAGDSGGGVAATPAGSSRYVSSAQSRRPRPGSVTGAVVVIGAPRLDADGGWSDPLGRRRSGDGGTAGPAGPEPGGECGADGG